MHTVADLYYFNYGSEVKITLGKITLYEKVVQRLVCNKFNDFQELVNSVCRVVINTDNWRQGSCRCRMLQKEYMCVHVLGLSIRLGLVICPLDAIDIALQKKRSRGAPKKA